ncbi:MAG: Mth938-like domain-containing protein [Kiloniellales bacterium]
MDIAPRIPAGRQLVESYGERRFRVSERLFEGSVLVLPLATSLWAPDSAAEIAEDSLNALLGPDLEVELLLLGCGARTAAVPQALARRLAAHGIRIESMDTGAAARTYNLQAAEGQRVAAALIAVD